MRRARGFTLIEVLVALAIVAIGMAAVLEALTSSANTAVYLQDKTLAEWVALNQMESVRLSGSLPAVQTTNGNVDLAGRGWEWQQTVANTQVPGVLRIDIDVRPADSTADDNRGWYASVTGMVGNSLAQPTPPGPEWFQGQISGQPSSGTGISGSSPSSSSTSGTSLQ